MKRELKFRAWDSKKKVYFYLDSIGLGNWFASDDPEKLYGTSFKNRWVIEQYTGLKDSKGKEIYEGDIYNYGLLAFNDTKKFGEECWKNLPKEVKSDDLSTLLSENCIVHFDYEDLSCLEKMISRNPDVEGIEVIGNIHQNKELLKD